MNSDRRQFVRYSCELNVHYVAAGEAPIRSLTRNIGVGGMTLFTPLPLKVGALLQVEVQLPHHPQPLRCRGRVVWSGKLLLEPSLNPIHPFEAGLHFLDLSPSDQTALVTYASSQSLPPHGGSTSF